MEGCKKYYAIDIIVDGNVIRKGKYTKVFTPVSYSWLDYNDIEIVDQNEIRRLDAAATEDNEVSEIYDNYHNFMSSSNTIDTVSAIPMDKHIVLVNWTPGGDYGAISMKYNVGIEGDNYLIYVSNVGENSSIIYLPQVEEGDTSVVNHVHVGSSFINVPAKGTVPIRATFKNNTWYWEVVSENQNSQQVVPIGDADFLVFRYLWNASAGKDLDTATELLNSGIPGVDNMAVGWGCPGNNNSTVTELMKWGGDNRGGDNTGSGQECVYVSVNDLRNKYLDTLPAITHFMAYATWFGTKGTGKAAFNLIAYKGGEMSQNGYNFINIGGEEICNKIHSFDVSTVKGMPDYKNSYTSVAKISYNKNSNTVSIAVGDTVIDDQNQISGLFDRVQNLETYVQNHKTEVSNIKNDIIDIKSKIEDLSTILDNINGEVV